MISRGGQVGADAWKNWRDESEEEITLLSYFNFLKMNLKNENR